MLISINRFIIDKLTREHPAFFERSGKNTLTNKHTGKTLHWEEDGRTLRRAEDGQIHGDDNYLNLLDALCSQVPEDIAICQLEDQQDWLAAIHLCAPNHWDPADKAGNPFSYIHGVVPSPHPTTRRRPHRMAGTTYRNG